MIVHVTRSAALAVGVALVAAAGCARSRSAAPDDGQAPAAAGRGGQTADDAAGTDGEPVAGASMAGQPGAAGSAGGVSAEDPQAQPSGGGAGSVAVPAAGTDASRPAGAGGATASSGPDRPLTFADLPVPPPGIELAEGAALPAGLWVGDMRRPETMGGPDVDPLAPCGSTSTRVTFQLTPPQDGAPATGVLMFGEPQWIPPAPTEPLEPWPPGDDFGASQCRKYWPSAGYPYAMRDGLVSANGRLTFRFTPSELYQPWCALQTSHPDVRMPEGGYSCVPPMPLDDLERCESNADECVIGAVPFNLCWYGACLCLEDACRATLNLAYRVDLQVEDNAMAGLLSPGGEEPPIELRLRRVD